MSMVDKLGSLTQLASLNQLAGKVSPGALEPDHDAIKMFVGQVPRYSLGVRFPGILYSSGSHVYYRVQVPRYMLEVGFPRRVQGSGSLGIF